VLECKKPNKLRVMELDKLGLVSKATDTNTIEFSMEGTFDQVDETLRRAVPKLFQFLDSLTSAASETNSDGRELPPYVVCVASGHTLNPTPQDFPAASDILFVVGGAKSSLPIRILFIGNKVMITWLSSMLLTSFCFSHTPSLSRASLRWLP
jgi:hypothetical protein